MNRMTMKEIARRAVTATKVFFLTLLLALAGVCSASAAPASLESGFAQPPEQTKPWCYWYWISDNISKEGITRDLESMARVGIGEALIGNVFLDDIPAGKIKVLSEEWWGLVEHAIREGGRVGVNIGMFNCPGWSQSGGPWIKPEHAMRYLTSSETRITGPAKFERKIPQPATPFQDVALLAFRAPAKDTQSIAKHSPVTRCAPAAAGVDKALDGNPETALAFPAGAGQGNSTFTIDFEVTEPFTARSLALTPGKTGWAGRCEVLAAGEDGQFKTVKQFKFDRSNMEIHVGFMPRGPVVAAFPATTAKKFRLAFTHVGGQAALAEIELSEAARVESVIEKQLAKMHPTPLPMWDTYLWPTSVEPEAPELTIPTNGVINLTGRLLANDVLRWEVPPGDWIILRTGMTPTGTRNAPASPEGRGLEVDKMNRAAAKFHFEAFMGQVLKRMPADQRKALTHVVADSYEMGSENWTYGFETTFRARYGYDPLPWLPVLTGRIVGSAERSDRFLWDLRRLVADHVAKDYVGGLREQCNANGLKLWLENYGHWGFPAEFLQYGGASDCVGGEYWVTGDLGSIECRAASSCANTYGKPVVSAESFTGGPAFQNAPWGLKARGDWAFCEGINHFVLHVYIHQPREDWVPGMNAWFGTEFDRHNTWFESSKTWVEYLRRCCFLLQQGNRVADAAYFIGEDAPKMTGVRRPELPAGHDFDYINAEVILDKLSVKGGRLVLPHGTSYRALVLPELPTMRPEVLQKIQQLVKAGATVVGTPPSRSPSLEHFPECDARVNRVAAELWGEAAPAKAGKRAFGKGALVWGRSMKEVFGDLGVGPDFTSATRLRFTHRFDGDTHIYFVANPKPESVATTAAFRVENRAPELWWPDSGRVEKPAVYDLSGDTVRLSLNLGPNGSVFVIFREKAASDRIARVTRNGEPVYDLQTAPVSETEKPMVTNGLSRNFTMALWVKPAADTPLFPEANQGVKGMGDARNDALFPPHGSTFSGDSGHAGCGLAAGRNGICVFEHGANYFAPVLVCAAPLTNWVHVAVVYRDGQPSLYLNGALARKGLKSSFTVHPGSLAQPSGNPQFRGKLGTFETVAQALDETEIAKLMAAMPQPGNQGRGMPLLVKRAAKGSLEIQASQPGAYELKTAKGKIRKFNVASVPAGMELNGPWEVNFDPKWGGPEKVSFAQLEDWARRAEPGIKYYSGKATYRRTFEWTASAANPPSSIYLDLGEVRDMATVRVNGKTLATLWQAPWRVELTGALQSGSNTLEIEVTNPWNNRLVGDAKLPADQRRTFIIAPTVGKDTALMPAGLLGPVTLETATIITVR